MKRTKILGLVLGAVFAMSAVAASVASAGLPEFTVSTTFTGTSGTGTLETQSGATVICTSNVESGTITAPKAVLISAGVKFKGCTATILGKAEKCGTPPSSGEITTKSLSGTLGYVKAAAPKEVGIDLKPTSGTVLAEFECETTAGAKTKLVVSGSVIGIVTPINTVSKSFTLTFKQSKGVQSVKKLEGEAEDVLSTVIGTAAASVSGLETTASLTTAVNEEIKA